jgi:hypothetical protein
LLFRRGTLKFCPAAGPERLIDRDRLAGDASAVDQLRWEFVMSDDGTKVSLDVEAGGPEMAALKLLEMVAAVEGKALSKAGARDRIAADRNWILDTYSQCLKAALGSKG